MTPRGKGAATRSTKSSSPAPPAGSASSTISTAMRSMSSRRARTARGVNAALATRRIGPCLGGSSSTRISDGGSTKPAGRSVMPCALEKRSRLLRDLEHVGVLRDRPERIEAGRLEPRDRRLRSQPRPRGVRIPVARVPLRVDEVGDVDARVRHRAGHAGASRASVRGQAEQALPDDVALDLARATLDRVGARREEPLHPSAAVERVRIVGREQRVRTEDRHGRDVQALAHAGPEQLHQARLRPELLAAREPGEGAPVVEAEELDVDPRAREQLADDGVVDPTPGCARLHEALERELEQHLLLPHEGGAPLVRERRVGDGPALVLGADAVVDRHLHAVEEHLVELAVTGDLAQRTDLDTRRRASGSPASRSHGAAERSGRSARGRSPSRPSARATTTPSGRSPRRCRRAAPRASASEARSLPASGSLKSWHQTSSPERIRSIQRVRWGSVPWAMSVGPTRLIPARPRSGGVFARASSSL